MSNIERAKKQIEPNESQLAKAFADKATFLANFSGYRYLNDPTGLGFNANIQRHSLYRLLNGSLLYATFQPSVQMGPMAATINLTNIDAQTQQPTSSVETVAFFDGENRAVVCPDRVFRADQCHYTDYFKNRFEIPEDLELELELDSEPSTVDIENDTIVFKPINDPDLSIALMEAFQTHREIETNWLFARYSTGNSSRQRQRIGVYLSFLESIDPYRDLIPPPQSKHNNI